ncbi:MAG: MBL fold metallo-hydrolase, partial [Flavobacteriaceae bacterium]
MKITFLGTGTSQGIPVIGSQHPVCLSENPKDKRLRSSVLIQWQEKNYVIDCGPDFRQQMLRAKCLHLDGLLFTHEHADHTSGIDDIRPFFFRQGNIPIYASDRVVADLTRRFSYIFQTDNKYPGTPAVETHTIQKNKVFSLEGKQVVP